jgi:hypothetical protein
LLSANWRQKLYTIRSGKDKKDFFDLENLASPISNFSKGLSLKKKKKRKEKGMTG